MKICSLLLTAMCGFPGVLAAQREFLLYPAGEIPDSKADIAVIRKSEIRDDGLLIVTNVTAPKLTVFSPAPEKANGTAIVIYPGGGYAVLAAGHEGIDVAKALNEVGITAFVVEYRLPDPRIMKTPEIGPLQDAQRALQMVRERAAEWNVNPAKVGVMGFSAGGHLASTVGTRFASPAIDNPAQTTLRPDFMILLYPVISADPPLVHRGSFANLLGKNASQEKFNEYSSEKNVSANTPPTFLVHASDDAAVLPGNSIVFYEALLRHHVPAELHLYQNGGHGFGLNNKTTADRWIDRLTNWMKENKWL